MSLLTGHLAAWMLRAALTISRKSLEKFKLGFKPIIRPLVKYERSTT
jgi:hypothetical protein